MTSINSKRYRNSAGGTKISEEPEEPRRSNDWNVTWEANQGKLFELTLSATPAQRLAWLEDALTFAYQCGFLKPRVIHSVGAPTIPLVI